MSEHVPILTVTRATDPRDWPYRICEPGKIHYVKTIQEAAATAYFALKRIAFQAKGSRTELPSTPCLTTCPFHDLTRCKHACHCPLPCEW